MKIVNLQSLTFKNIKGFEDYTVMLDGKNADIFGRNATRKTSIYDLFLWVLFGKDSFNRSDYQIKPQDEDGNERHNLESIAEVILTVDGKQLKLKRMLSEKWVHKRGTQTEVFEGNETNYWVNDVPTKAKDYAVEINMMIRENIFKLLTNPLFFNTNEKGFGWQERRKILFEISGDVSDEQVINSSSELIGLTAILDGHTTDGYKLIVNEQIKNTKSKLEGIPSRIDEQKRNTPQDAVDYTAIETSLQTNKATLEGIEAELATNAQGANLYRQKQQQAYKLQGELDARKREIDTESGAGLKRVVAEKVKLESDKHQLESELQQQKQRLASGEMKIKVAEESLVASRAKWKTESEKVYVAPTEDFTCPTCKQSLPSSDKVAKLAELEANFNANKNSRLAEIRASGKPLSDSLAQLKLANENLSKEIQVYEEKLVAISGTIVEKEGEVAKEQGLQSQPNYAADTAYFILFTELQKVNEELDKPIEDTSSELLTKKREVTEIIEGLNKTLNQKEVVEKAKIRIEELKKEESKLAAELSEYERHDFLLKQFTKTKVKILEDAINNRFKTVKFKMFDILQDGTEKEICKTLVNTNGVWVEFDGANNGGKINAGLSIIEMLSEHYGVSCPIFVDNAESVTGFVDIKSQVVKLIVSEPDQTLRVEVLE